MKEVPKDVVNRLKKVISKKLTLNMGSDEITLNTPLIGKGLGLDSVSILGLVVGLEEEFNVIFDSSELSIELFENIGSLADYINKKLN